jgi:hypothetical protein
LTPTEVIGFIVFLWAASCILGVGLAMGIVGGLKAATWAWGPINISVGPIQIRTER